MADILAYAHSLKRENKLEANTISPHRFCYEFSSDITRCSSLESVGGRLFDTLNEPSLTKDPLLGWLLSYIEPGGVIQPHLDNQGIYQKGDKKHLRCNVVIQKEPDSGTPIIEGRLCQIAEGDLWCFFASHQMHASTVVRRKPRIVLQYGFATDSAFSIEHIGTEPTILKSWARPLPNAGP